MSVGWHLEAGPGTCPAARGDAPVLRIGLALRDGRRAFPCPHGLRKWVTFGGGSRGGVTNSSDVRPIPMMPLRPEPRGDIAVGEGGALTVAASALLLSPLLVRPSGGSTAVHWAQASRGEPCPVSLEGV